MHHSSPRKPESNVGSASMQRIAYGLLNVPSNGAHLFGSTSPPGLSVSPRTSKPLHDSGTSSHGVSGSSIIGSSLPPAAPPAPLVPAAPPTGGTTPATPLVPPIPLVPPTPLVPPAPPWPLALTPPCPPVAPMPALFIMGS